MSNYLRLKSMLYIVSLSAIAIVVGFVEITWPLAVWLKLDFSEVVILVSVLILGTKKTFVVIFLRSVVRFLITMGGPFGVLGTLVGESLAILASVSIVLAYFLAKKMLAINEKPLVYEVNINNDKFNLKQFLVITTWITLTLTIVLFTVNFFITTPLFFSLMGLTQSGQLHFTVFSYLPDSIGFDGSWLKYLIFSIVTYVPFNLVKGILISVVFLLLKPRMKYLEL